jgi:quaternary ammonium compound-resistance protein SugE
MAWVYLLGAGACEVAGTTLYRYTDGLARLVPTVAFFAMGVLSLYLLYRSLDGIPLGTAYAVWTGVGAAGTAILGVWLYEEPASTLRIVFLTLLIGSIVGLKFVSDQ